MKSDDFKANDEVTSHDAIPDAVVKNNQEPSVPILTRSDNIDEDWDMNDEKVQFEDGTFTDRTFFINKRTGERRLLYKFGVRRTADGMYQPFGMQIPHLDQLLDISKDLTTPQLKEEIKTELDAVLSSAINSFYQNLSEGFKRCPVPTEHVSKLEQILDGFIYHGLEVLFRDELAGFILPGEIDFEDNAIEDDNDDGEEDEGNDGGEGNDDDDDSGDSDDDKCLQMEWDEINKFHSCGCEDFFPFDSLMNDRDE